MARDASDLAHRLAREAEAVCRHYLSNGRRQGNYWLVGDVEEHAGPLDVRAAEGRRIRQGRGGEMDRICCAESYVAPLRLGAVPQAIDSFYAT